MQLFNYVIRMFASFVFFQIAFLCSMALAQVIPSVDKVDWQNAGLLNIPPSSADTVFQIIPSPGQDLDTIVSSAIGNAQSFTNDNQGSWAIIYFPAGTYVLNETIELDHNCQNIIFQGDGSSETILQFNFGDANPNCFYPGAKLQLRAHLPPVPSRSLGREYS